MLAGLPDLLWKAALSKCTQHKCMAFYSVAVVERMMNTSLLLFFNKNENNCDSNKSNNRSAAHETVLENPSIAQSSLYVAGTIQHFVPVYIYMLQYISTSIRHGAYVLPCHKHQQWQGINSPQTTLKNHIALWTHNVGKWNTRSWTWIIRTTIWRTNFWFLFVDYRREFNISTFVILVCTYSI